ncbi:MAG: hypothetical protein K6E34_09255, partial [Lachnospiraceae bacterium]|nr:hypothetical protein [Lachnospiraceae bacterium]
DVFDTEGKLSFEALNVKTAKMVMESSGDLINWMRSMKRFVETDTQIFVHAGIDEDAGEEWEWGTADHIFTWKYPPTFGRFYKNIIAGHVGTGRIAGDRSFHDIYYDGASHYYIDGSVYRTGNLLLLAYDETDGKYYQMEKQGRIQIGAYRK